MAVTKVASFNFTNQVKIDHVSGYFRKKLGWGNFAWKLDMDFTATPGNTVTFPYFGILPPAEEPGEDDRLTVHPLGDMAFTGTVAEAAIAWGITDAARVRAGMPQERWDEEGLAQGARVIAEKIDERCLTELKKVGSHTVGRTAPANFAITTAFTNERGADTPAFKAEQCSIARVRTGLTNVFGDKQDEVKAMVFHSRTLNDLITDDTAGLLKADANSPWNAIGGFKGTLFGKAVFEMDTAPEGNVVTVTDSASATQKYKTYNVVCLKEDPYALVMKQDPKLEQARDQLGRRDIYSITQWYTFRNLHKEISTEDERVAFLPFLTNERMA